MSLWGSCSDLLRNPLRWGLTQVDECLVVLSGSFSGAACLSTLTFDYITSRAQEVPLRLLESYRGYVR